MIRSLAATLVLVVLMLALKHVYVDVLGLEKGIPAAVSLGFILVAAYTFSRLFVPLKIPRICGYMIMGMICGPFGLELISRQGLDGLRLIEKGAIALIAVTAGGELRWSVLRRDFRTLTILVACLTLVLFAGTCAAFVGLAPKIGLLAGAPGAAVMAAAVLIGVTAVAKSPATAVAVIKETHARGRLTETCLTVLLILDVIAVIAFAIALGFAERKVGGGEGMNAHDLLGLAWHVAGALPIGILIGFLASLYLRFARGTYLLFMFLLCLLMVEISVIWKIELIMMAVMAGFTVENIADRGDELIRAIDRSDLPVYVAFFTVAGASIDFPFLLANWGLSLTFFLLIGTLTFLGTELGGWLGKVPTPHRHYLFMGLIAQAGLNLSFAAVLRDRLNLPLSGGQTLGYALYTLIVARVAAKQLIGPILFRFALGRVGEIGAGKREQESS